MHIFNSIQTSTLKFTLHNSKNMKNFLKIYGVLHKSKGCCKNNKLLVIFSSLLFVMSIKTTSSLLQNNKQLVTKQQVACCFYNNLLTCTVLHKNYVTNSKSSKKVKYRR